MSDATGRATATRREHDSIGAIDVPADALWGAQTQRALLHFAIGDERMPLPWVHALALCKGAAARVNQRLGRLDADRAAAIAVAADEVARGAHDAQFVLSVWQSGSGTQSHMNVNEVIARLAARQAASPVHPNDHVNLGQSSNDMVPSAIHVAAALALQRHLLPALDALLRTLAAQAARHDSVIKLGRTHLQDAVPITFGQELGAWRSQLLIARAAIVSSQDGLHALAVGGTAVGSGLNTHRDFGAAVCRDLAQATAIAFVPAPDRFAAIAGHEALLVVHGALKTLAVALGKMANDLRLLASGPRGGLAEVRLPANEPGSSIMPGKVNPTQCEALAMVCLQIIANDLALGLGAAAGHLQLNTCKPLIAFNLLRSLQWLGDAMASFERYTLRGLEPDAPRMGALLAGSLMLVTALAPHIGYERAAQIAQRAHAEGTSLRGAAIAAGIDGADFDRWADPARMLAPRA
jgi:fumarate hydratase, class II